MKTRSGLLASGLLLALSLATLLASSLAAAQEEEYEADPLLASLPEESASSVTFLGNLWLDQDHVSGLPADRPDINRTRGRFRFGLSWAFAPSWELVAVGRIGQGTDSNDDNRRNNDNQRSDDYGIDELLVRWRDGDEAMLQFGKSALPIDLSPMLWDPDIRPAGIAYERAFSLGELDRLTLVAGYFEGQHLYGDESLIGAAQIAWDWRAGAPQRASVVLSWLDFSQLDELAMQGLGRTNRIAAGQYVSDFNLIDLQLNGHAEFGSWPIDLSLEYVHNLGADDSQDGWRIGLSAGDRQIPGGLEFGIVWQRIQRDAVLAAFNSDDWWFHSYMHGQLAWVGYGIDRTWNLRLFGTREQRDGLSDYTHRVQLEVNANW
ncbi:hypothetical protein [Dokdonella sp.]|uniref:hypothetical protein n=1 Tax=Dokdonella sp. TaxID=2291710 RepID=UPI00352701D6